MITTLAELNAQNRAFWQKTTERCQKLLTDEYYQNFVRRAFVERHPPAGDTPARALSRLRKQKSFEYRLLEEVKNLGRMKAMAREPRRKTKSGVSLHDLIREFAQRPENRRLPTKILWRPFFDFLCDQGLNPIITADDAYEFEGKNASIAVREANFQKRVSDLAPRRTAKRH